MTARSRDSSFEREDAERRLTQLQRDGWPLSYQALYKRRKKAEGR